MVINSNIISSRQPEVETVVGVTVPELLRDISQKHGWGDALAFVSLSIYGFK